MVGRVVRVGRLVGLERSMGVRRFENGKVRN